MNDLTLKSDLLMLAKSHAVRDQLPITQPMSANTWQAGELHSGLSWTHYRTLLKVERLEARNFYEIETLKNGWSARQLERQIASLLFDRLLIYLPSEAQLQAELQRELDQLALSSHTRETQ